MTLLDAPKYDAAGARRRQQALWVALGTVVVLFVGFWLVAGRPVDWPWNWYTHLRGRTTINTFLKDVEKNDLAAAYGVWLHDPDWQKHPPQAGAYDFTRFQQDWSPTAARTSTAPSAATRSWPRAWRATFCWWASALTG